MFKWQNEQESDILSPHNIFMSQWENIIIRSLILENGEQRDAEKITLLI